MEVQAHVNLVQPRAPYGSTSCVSIADGPSLAFRAPQELVDAAFPAQNAAFPVESVVASETTSSLYERLRPVSGRFVNRQNSVVFSFGQRGTNKRQLLLGSGSDVGAAARVLKDVVAAQPRDGSSLVLSAYVLATGDTVIDLLNPRNESAHVADSVKEGPRVKMTTMQTVSNANDISAAFTSIVASYESHFAAVLREDFVPEELALPPYNPGHIVVSLVRYDAAGTQQMQQQTADGSSGASVSEANSIHFIVLGDSERPVLCGIDAAQLAAFEKNHKILASVAGVFSAIRCNRLRVPYGKSKLTGILKRAFNAEKNNPNNEVNKPTHCLLLVTIFADDGHAEETYHTLTMLRRVMNVIGGTGVGSITRDLAAEKWRLEQDILELKDELSIARAVHDYRPCIFEQAKPVVNIQEEETKRITAIQKRREEARERAQQEIRAKAQEEARAIIEQQEREAEHTLADLDRLIEAKRVENSQLLAERAKKMKEYERHLEKIRKKKDEEEAAVAKLKEEIRALEAELKEQQALIEKKEKQLEVASTDQARGRDAILKEREELKRKRAALFEDRRKQREAWLKEIQDTNELVLRQVQQLARERSLAAERGSNAGIPDAKAEETEASVMDDIASINAHLPKLISLDDVPADAEASESIRKQLEEFFEREKEDYTRKIQEEAAVKDELERKIETYRHRLKEQQAKQKKEHLSEATKKDRHLQSLTDQVITFLQQGLRMIKVSSTGNIRRRFFFLSEDCKKLFACEIDDVGVPINRRKPTTTVYLRDVRRVTLGLYTPSFLNFAGEVNLRRSREEAMRGDGCYSTEPTGALTAQNLGKYQYRSFALELKNYKTLELVCESDSDFEAWLVAFKRLFGYRTPFERTFVASAGGVAAQQQSVVDTFVDIAWGAPLSLLVRPGAEKLTRDEQTLCSEHHIPPSVFLKTRNEMITKSQTCFVTVYDMRVASTLDLLRAQILYEFFLERKVLPMPN